MTLQEKVFRRDEVAKVWRARFHFGERNTWKGAWIGAEAGLGAGVITAAALSKTSPGDPCIGCGLFPIYGSGAGAVIGILKRKGHKKESLIYSI